MFLKFFEQMDLKQNNAVNSWIEVDLLKHPDQLVHELKLLETFVEGDNN